MNNQKEAKLERDDLLRTLLNISIASEILVAIIRTVCNDDNLGNDRIRWLLAGALEQIEKIKQITESIDGLMWEKENFLI